jgi:putative oxidoreductase
MERWLGRYSETLYALLRFVVGVLFACHGAQKLFGALGGTAVRDNPMMLVAGIIELAGGLLISGLMAAAYFMAHASRGFWPIVNQGELAVVYCFLFLYIAAKGSGPLSVDRAIRKGA